MSVDHASEWPGVWTFCSHLESCFEELLEDRFEIIWKVLGRDPPSTSVDCWHWCFAVIKSFQSLSGHCDVSIEDAYTQLIADSKLSFDEESRGKQVLRAIFAVLCWSSATLTPIFDDKTISAAIINRNGRDSARRPSVAAMKFSEVEFSIEVEQPLPVLFHRFRDGAGKAEYSESTQSDDVLYQSSLDYFSLLTIGRVKLKWVNTLSLHLAFNRSKRTLYIFRFPSYCAINVLFNSDTEFIKEYVLICQIFSAFHVFMPTHFSYSFHR